MSPRTPQNHTSKSISRLRPGDPASAETAKNLIAAMFERPDRYDLSEVGRYKMNQRLELDKKKTNKLLDAEDLIDDRARRSSS